MCYRLLVLCPVWALRRNAPLIRFLMLALYILFACLYYMLSHLSFFLHFFLTYLLPYLSFPLRIDPLLFVFFLCVVVHFF